MLTFGAVLLAERYKTFYTINLTKTQTYFLYFFLPQTPVIWGTRKDPYKLQSEQLGLRGGELTAQSDKG